MNLHKSFLLFFIFIIQSCAHLSPCPLETLAAFDIGSGTTKMVLASKYSCQNKIEQIHLEVSKPVAYAKDLESRSAPLFGPEISFLGEETLREFVSLAREHGATRVMGVATAAFRKAQNASQLIQHWNELFDIELKIISQDEEAMLAYAFVQSKVQSNSPILVWDIGGGSQQFITVESGKKKIVKSSLASVSFREKLGNHLNRASINPLTPEEFSSALMFSQTLAKNEIDQDLMALIQLRPMIYGLGGVHAMSIRHQLGLSPGSPIQRDHLELVAFERSKLQANEITGPYASTEVSNLMMVLGIMKAFDIKSYQWFQANLSHAVLLAE